MPTQREHLIEVCEKYLFHGLVEHDGSKVPLAPDCWRIEQGVDTGNSAAKIREQLASEIMNLITGLDNLRWLVEGDEGVVYYDLHTKASPKPVLIAERFKVIDGQISEIEAIFAVQQS